MLRYKIETDRSSLIEQLEEKYPDKALLSIEELADFFNVVYLTAYRWVRIYGVFPATKVGGKIFVPKQSIVKYLEENID